MLFKKTEGKGQDVVILHGWTCDHTYVEPIAKTLSSRFRITLFDLPGAGQSAWPSHCKTIHDIADLLLPHLPQQAAFIGWSFGGLVALSLAARHPERVRQWIGLATTPKFVEDADWPGLPKPGYQSLFPLGQEIGIKGLLRGFFEAEFAAFHPKPPSYHALMRLLETRPSMPLETWMAGLRLCDSTDLRKDFHLLKCPLDLILGEKDESIPLAAVEKIQKLNPRVRIHVIPQAGHLPVWTHPAQVNAILEKALL